MSAGGRGAARRRSRPSEALAALLDGGRLAVHQRHHARVDDDEPRQQKAPVAGWMAVAPREDRGEALGTIVVEEGAALAQKLSCTNPKPEAERFEMRRNRRTFLVWHIFVILAWAPGVARADRFPQCPNVGTATRTYVPDIQSFLAYSARHGLSWTEEQIRRELIASAEEWTISGETDIRIEISPFSTTLIGYDVNDGINVISVCDPYSGQS